MAKKSHLINTGLVLLSIVIMLAMFEAALRFYLFGTLAQPAAGKSALMPHATRTYTLEPGFRGRHQELDFSVPVVVNEQGLRGPAVAPKGRRQRLLIVGDSATYGSGVAVEQIIPTLLGEQLGPEQVEVINGSIPVYSTVQEMLFLAEEGLAYEPDLVILAFSPNTDMQTNTLALQRLYQRKRIRPYASLDATGALQIDFSRPAAYYEKTKNGYTKSRRRGFFRSLILYRYIKNAVKGLKRTKYHDPNIFIGWPFLAEFAPQHSTQDLSAQDYEALWAEGWAVTKAIILRMRQAAEAKGAGFAMMVMAPKLQVDAAYQARVVQAFPGLKLDPFRINRAFEEFGRKEGIPVLDALTPLVEAAATGEDGLYFDIEDEHMTAKAHRLVAASLARQLRSSGLLRLDPRTE